MPLTPRLALLALLRLAALRGYEGARVPFARVRLWCYAISRRGKAGSLPIPPLTRV